MARELCTLADVTAYAPGYSPDAATDALLERFIDSESRAFHQQTRREFRPIEPAVDPRRFYLTSLDERRRMVRVGDLASISSVQIHTRAGTVLETVSSADYVRIADTLTMRSWHEEWEPTRALWFPIDSPSPAANLLADSSVLVVSGTWGFPQVPADVREAVAAMVLRRYVSDVASLGTELSEALETVNLTALLTNARTVRKSYNDLPGLD